MRYGSIFLSWCLGLLGACAQPNSPQAKPSPYGQAPYELVRERLVDSAAVVAAHPAASRVGLAILQKGGNAVDAMVAVHLALAVVYPRAGNIGGGGFMMLRLKDGQVHALDFREKAPLNAHRDMYLNAQGQAIDSLSRAGFLAAGVPGSVAGLWQAHQKFGQLPWADLVQPAIELAEATALSPGEALVLNKYAPELRRHNTHHKPALLAAQGQTWKEGQILAQPALAQTLRYIRDQGREGFYAGPVADSIAAEMSRHGGLINQEDLKQYQAQWREPLSRSFRGYTVWSMPPSSSGGLALLQLLGMVEDYPLEKWGFHSPQAIHLMVEAERRVYADRAKYPGDPDFVKVPLNQLLDKAYLKQRMADYRADKASPSTSIEAGTVAESEETTHYAIVDAQGNAVSVTTTINTNFGAKVISNAGFVWNNEMDDFSAKPGSPNVFGLLGGEANAIAPGKRMLSSMTPTIVTKDQDLYLVLGTPGGATIITSVFQVILNVLVFELPLKQAVHAKRFHHQWKPDLLYHEAGIWPTATLRRLKALGHTPRQREYIGMLEAIRRLPSGQLQAVGDNRGESTAEGF